MLQNVASSPHIGVGGKPYGHGARHWFSFPLSSGLKPTFAIAESLGRTRAVLGQLLGFVTSGRG